MGLTAAAVSEATTVEIRVAAVNDAPVAVDDTASVAAGATASIDVLANDSDVDGDVLTVRLLTPPARGTATCSETACSYTASDSDPDGNVTFAYEVDDGAGGTDSAVVTVSVQGAATPTVTTTTTESPAVDAENRLPRTGSDTGTLLLLSAVLAAAGTLTNAASAVTRRR